MKIGRRTESATPFLYLVPPLEARASFLNPRASHLEPRASNLVCNNYFTLVLSTLFYIYVPCKRKI